MLRRIPLVAILVVTLVGALPDRARAQLTDPCQLTCATVLGVTSFAFATGAATAVGRVKGGYSTARQGALVWSGSFLAAALSGVALAGNGERQERAVYSAALGVGTGALLGLTVEALGDDSAASRWAATLIGASVGAVVGGVVGAATWEPSDVAAVQPAIAASFSISTR